MAAMCKLFVLTTSFELHMGYKWDKKAACFLETETVCSKDSEVPSTWLFVQSLPIQYGMQELIAVLKIDEYISSQTTFSHSKCSMLVEFG